MATFGDVAATSEGPRAGRIAAWSIGTVALTVVTLLAGVGIAAMLGRRGNAADWSKWSDVGQTFGVLSSIISSLALAALLITARMQFREMQENRKELEHQRLSLARNHSEFARTAEANRGLLHLEILKLAINDPKLAEVWPSFAPNLSVDQNRQYLYANVIYQFQLTLMKVTGYDYGDEDVLDVMRYLFTSPVMREYWEAAAQARSSLLPGTEEYLMAQKVDTLWRQYEAVYRTHRGQGEPTAEWPARQEAA
ncbi:MAG: DUF6082 family protein [Actinoplanes sp.]